MRQINWNNTTINQYFILQKNLSGVEGHERALRIACELHGLDYLKERQKGATSSLALIQSIAFFGHLPMDSPKCTAKIGGKEILFKPLASITSGEFIDIQSYEHDEKLNALETVGWQIARLCASPEIKALPDGDGYKSTEIINKWHIAVLQMSMNDFCSIASFFLNKRKNSKNVFLLFLVNKLNNQTTSQVQQIQAELTQLKHFSLSLKGLRLKISEVYLRSYRKLLALRCLNLRLSLTSKTANNEL